jgi:hypothetical protein
MADVITIFVMLLQEDVQGVQKRILVETGLLLHITKGVVGSWLPECTAPYKIVSDFALAKSKAVVFDDGHCNRRGR